MKKRKYLRNFCKFFWITLITAFSVCSPREVIAQAVPYARNYAHSKEDVENALKELQAYSGQKLPIVDGFVATGQESLSHFERAFYQYSIELLPGDSGGTIVRLTAKITAWYADRDPAKSGYQALPSNGRLELDLLDRLTDKFDGKGASSSSRSILQAPRPKLDLGASGNSAITGKSYESPAVTAPSNGGASEDANGIEALKTKRAAAEKRMLELKSELDSLKELKHNQAHPRNLVIVKKNSTPVLTRPEEGSKVLFAAAENDEFEFIEAEGEWFHVQISGASRGWIRRSRAEAMDPRWNVAPTSAAAEEKTSDVFQVTKEENSAFPGDWAPLQGKIVKIYWVQPNASPSAATSSRDKREFTRVLFQRAWSEPSRAQSGIAGVVVLFDASDGGQVSAPLPALQQWIEGKGNEAAFWQKCSIDPPELFKD